jgi:hypothetical protein
MSRAITKIVIILFATLLLAVLLTAPVAAQPRDLDVATCAPERISVSEPMGVTDYKIVGESGDNCIVEYSANFEFHVTRARCLVPRSVGTVLIVTRRSHQAAPWRDEFCEIIYSEPS